MRTTRQVKQWLIVAVLLDFFQTPIIFWRRNYERCLTEHKLQYWGRVIVWVRKNKKA